MDEALIRNIIQDSYKKSRLGDIETLVPVVTTYSSKGVMRPALYVSRNPLNAMVYHKVDGNGVLQLVRYTLDAAAEKGVPNRGKVIAEGIAKRKGVKPDILTLFDKTLTDQPLDEEDILPVVLHEGATPKRYSKADGKPYYVPVFNMGKIVGKKDLGFKGITFKQVSIVEFTKIKSALQSAAGSNFFLNEILQRVFRNLQLYSEGMYDVKAHNTVANPRILKGLQEAICSDLALICGFDLQESDKTTIFDTKDPRHPLYVPPTDYGDIPGDDDNTEIYVEKEEPRNYELSTVTVSFGGKTAGIVFNPYAGQDVAARIETGYVDPETGEEVAGAHVIATPNLRLPGRRKGR